MNDEDAGKDYVEVNVSDMRRTKDVNAAMAVKLNKQEEETKQTQGKRPSRAENLRHRKSVLMTSLSFAPMKPIVESRAVETQTESEPLKTFSTIDTQTQSVTTTSTRMQTESPETRDGSMQTLKTLTDTVEIQTDTVGKVDFDVQVSLSSLIQKTETQCQTSDVDLESNDTSSDY